MHTHPLVLWLLATYAAIMTSLFARAFYLLSNRQSFLRRAESIAPRRPDNLSPEALEDCRVAHRVWQRCFLEANGAVRYVTGASSNNARTEILARAWAESYRSFLLSGEHTNTYDVVVQHLGQAWGLDGLRDALRTLRSRYTSDALDYGRLEPHPVDTWCQGVLAKV